MAVVAISYSNDVAPILALHCNSCHGAAGGFSTRSYRELMAGGNLGTALVPGDPDNSLLVHFIEGRRGEQRRMPLGGAPLSAQQITTIRQWIAEGAAEDAVSTRKHTFTLPKVRANRSQILQVFCRVLAQSYLVVRAFDADKRRVLWEDVASIKSPPQPGDAGEPGQLIHWQLRPRRSWPRHISLELTIMYAEKEPSATEFFVTTQSSRTPPAYESYGRRAAATTSCSAGSFRVEGVYTFEPRRSKC